MAWSCEQIVLCVECTFTGILYILIVNMQVTLSYQKHLRCLREGCPEGGPAVYVLIQCTPLSVEEAGVAPGVTLRFTACKHVSVQVREPPWL